MKKENNLIISDNTEKVEYRFKSFDSISSGNYWRAIEDINNEAITKDMVLLIESIRYLNGEIHNIFLRAHPLVYGKQVRIESDDGTTRWEYLKSHRFLFKDFIVFFEYEPDFERIRENELSNIKSEMDELNAQLLEAQVNPEILNKVVDDKLAKDEKESGDGKSQALVVPSQIPNTLSKVISNKPTTQMIKDMVKVAEKHVSVAQIKAGWMKDKTTQIAETINKMVPFYDERAAASLALADETIRSVNKIKRGIESLYLYTGEDVDVLQICKGVSAPSDIRLSLCANKLYVDEELSVFLDLEKWFDFKNMQMFYDALRDYPALIEQIFPTQRCMLVMCVTKRNIDYGDYYSNVKNNNANKQVFLMVRDGQRVFIVDSPVESHLSASNLFPRQQDLDGIFKGIDGVDLTLDDITYTDAMEKHEIFELHYKRWLILAAGLDEREKIFGDFYPGYVGLGFVTLEFQERYLNFIQDEHALEHDCMSVEQWIKNKNEYTRPGSTVFLSLYNSISKISAPGAYTNRESRNGGYETRVNVPYGCYDTFVVNKKGVALNVSTQLNGSISYNKNFTVNIDLNKVEHDTGSNLPYLCLDRVKPDELYFYIHNRKARNNHLSYIKTFKEALVHVEKQVEKQAKLRALLKNAISILDGSLDSEYVELLMDDSISTWTAYNRGKDIAELRPSDKKQWSVLLNHVYYSLNQQEYCTNIESLVVNAGYKPLRIVLSGNASMKVYYQAHEAEMDNRLQEHAWVHRSIVNLGKAKMSLSKPVWVGLVKKNAAETLIKDFKDANAWYDKEDVFGSYNKKQKAFDVIDNWEESFKSITSLESDVFKRNMEVAIVNYERLRYEPGRYVKDLNCRIPVGFILNSNGINTISLVVKDILIYLASISDISKCFSKLRCAFTSQYANISHANEMFESGVSNTKKWKLLYTEGLDIKDDIYFHSAKGHYYHNFLDEDKLSAYTPLLSEHIHNYLNKEMDAKKVNYIGRTSFLSCVFSNKFEISNYKHFDTILNLELPSNYHPCCVVDIKVCYKDNDIEYNCFDIYDWGQSWEPLRADLDDSGFKSQSKLGFFSRADVKTFHTSKQALDYIMNSGGQIKGSNVIPDYPQPKIKGVKRYYLVDGVK